MTAGLDLGARPELGGTPLQAVYTWSSRPLDGRPGAGFVAVSEDLLARMDWLEAITRSLSSFDSSPTTQRQIGRTVKGRNAVAFCKSDGGADAYGRPGRFFIHFVLADADRLPTSTILSIPDQWWLTGETHPVDSTVELPAWDEAIAVNPPRPQLDVDQRALSDHLRRLLLSGVVDVSSWAEADFATFFAWSPPWVDSFSDFHTSAGTSLLEFGSRDLSHYRWDRGAPPPSPWASSRVRNALSVDACLRAMDTIHEAVKPSQVAATTQSAPVTVSATRWALDGFPRLEPHEVDDLLQRRHSVAAELAQGNFRLPAEPRAHPQVVRWLAGFRSPDEWSILEPLLPYEAALAEMWSDFLPTSAMLSAAVLNGARRHTPLSLTLREPSEELDRAIEFLISDERYYECLVATLRFSRHAGGLAWQCLRSPVLDPTVLFQFLVPEVFGTDQEELFAAVSQIPEQFVRWVKVPDPYGPSVVEALSRDRHVDLWSRVRTILGRFRSG